MSQSTDIVIFLYEGVTALDAIGPYEVLSRIPYCQVYFTGFAKENLRTDNGFLSLATDRSIDEVNRADILVIPGGFATRQLLGNQALLAWIRNIDQSTRWTTSVCTGSLLLAAAGLLNARQATTHWLAMDQLTALGAKSTGERVVFSDKYVTAAGVSSGIDLALHLVARETNDEVAKAIQLAIEYDPQPPFDSGSPAKAAATTRQLVEAAFRERGL